MSVPETGLQTALLGQVEREKRRAKGKVWGLDARQGRLSKQGDEGGGIERESGECSGSAGGGGNFTRELDRSTVCHRDISHCSKLAC